MGKRPAGATVKSLAQAGRLSTAAAVQAPLDLPPILVVAAWLELIGGGLLLLGLFSRPVAFLLSGQMAVAYFMVHAPMGFFPALNMGEPAILYTYIFLYISVEGAGSWSIDALRLKSKTGFSLEKASAA